MDLTNRQAKKIYEQFREIKTIYGIKNSVVNNKKIEVYDF